MSYLIIVKQIAGHKFMDVHFLYITYINKEPNQVISKLTKSPAEEILSLSLFL